MRASIHLKKNKYIHEEGLKLLRFLIVIVRSADQLTPQASLLKYKVLHIPLLKGTQSEGGVSFKSTVYSSDSCVMCVSVQLDIVEFIPSLLYFGYTALMVLSFWLLTGTIGFYAAYMFIRKIYAAVKID